MSTFNDDTALVLHGGEEGEQRPLLALLVGSHNERRQGAFGRMCDVTKGRGMAKPPLQSALMMRSCWDVTFAMRGRVGSSVRY